MVADEIRFDAARFPLVCVEFHGACSDRQFEGYLAQMAAARARALREGVELVFIIDTLGASRPVTAKQRQMQAAEMNKQAQGLNVLAGMAFVIDNALVRGVLTAILWVQAMKWAHIVVSTREDAERWAASILARRRAAAI